MVDVDEPRTEPQPVPDRTTRIAAIWATAVAVPLALAVGIVAFLHINPEETDEKPTAASSSPITVPSTAVEMPATKLSAETSTVCLAVTSQLPTQVRNLPARKVSAGPEQNAAYGEPAITVACGVTAPVMCETLDQDATDGCVPLDTELLLMNRVCWYAQDAADGTTFTTMDREVPVRVVVPADYDNRAQWANEFSDVVVETDKSITEGLPSGCTIG
ncbi:DUF3515 family protein [Actinoplanes sp. NPDC051851]|uniref:DUF3515 family protein n=1 Tax=Actinoplanes sp. NPDC051851 TaxID=3154753 RepID=UPI00343FE740